MQNVGTYIDQIACLPDDEGPNLTPAKEFERRYLRNNCEAPPTTRYASPKSLEDLVKAREASVPKKTREDTQWCLNVWKDWSDSRNSISPATNKVLGVQELSSAELDTLALCLEQFVLEVRNKQGFEYAPETLHHLVCGIMRHVRVTRPAIDFFSDAEHFGNFTNTLNGEMKRLQGKGLGVNKKQAEVIDEEEEEMLWSSGVLGDHSPQALLNTIFYMCGLFFALRSGTEHRSLRLSPAQIKIIDTNSGVPYLLYREDVSKNHQGGLKHRHVKPKEVRHFANQDKPSRCFVRLFRLYLSKIHPDSPKTAFYYKPLTKCSQTGIWFSKQPLGHNTLEHMMAKMCAKAQIQGYKMNHSLRATAASRLYHKGVDEQLIMERTGHRSIEGVRSYKRTGEQQQIQVSNILQAAADNPSKAEQSLPPQANNIQPQNKSAVLSGLQLHSCSGITITINNYSNNTGP